MPGKMPRPIEATVHAGALAHNLARARAAAPDARVFAVVKADAYGHGIERAFAGLQGADGFALLDLAEAERLRALDWRGPILLLEGCFAPRDLELCSRLKLWHVVHDGAQIDWLAAHKTHEPHRVFLKMNSGMNRLGFRPEAFRAAWVRLNALPQVGEISLMTHFANADAPADAPADTPADASADAPAAPEHGIAAQAATFSAATADLPGERSLSNSAATLRHAADAAVRADWVRAGIMVYGSAPDFPAHGIDHWDLLPTMTLRSRIIATQDLQPGDAVGYGSTYTAAGTIGYELMCALARRVPVSVGE
jgi:alanine racemase